MSKAYVFVSCGQFTEAEKRLGKQIVRIVQSITGLDVFFAEEVHDLNGLDANILNALHDCVGFLTVMHPRGGIVRPDGSNHVRASVWIEQEIAIATYIQRVEKRQLPVIAFIHEAVGREGIRDLIHLNPIPFAEDSEVLTALPEHLLHWKKLPPPKSASSISFNIEGPPPAQIIKIRGHEKLTVSQVAYILSTDAIIATEETKLEGDAIEVPLNHDLLTKVWNIPRVDRNHYDHSGPAKIGLTISSGGRIQEYVIPIFMDYLVENSTLVIGGLQDQRLFMISRAERVSVSYPTRRCLAATRAPILIWGGHGARPERSRGMSRAVMQPIRVRALAPEV